MLDSQDLYQFDKYLPEIARLFIKSHRVRRNSLNIIYYGQHSFLIKDIFHQTSFNDYYYLSPSFFKLVLYEI